MSVLLEFYRAEKKIKFQIIRDLFFSYSNSSHSNKRFCLSFNNFKSLMLQDLNRRLIDKKEPSGELMVIDDLNNSVDGEIL